MAIKHVSYLDIPAPKRQKMAAQSVGRIREQLNDPTISPEAVDQLMTKLSNLEKWVRGELPAPELE